MAEIRSGLRHLLAIPALYDAFQAAVGAYAWHRRVLQRHVLPVLPHGARVLDIGCGTAEVLRDLPEHVRYHGVDRNAAYIARAQRRFSSRQARFKCAEFRGQLPDDDGRYDLILAIGLLHHLGDDDAGGLMAGARNVLAANGVLLTLDPVFTDKQSAAARFLIAHDRGRNVRQRDGYARLARGAFKHVEGILDERPMYIPYTGLIMICR
ncbi:MAG: class I SAM-dependent methyltransferase [Proteobacteria bacterium]|nr:class I SAM-dependent methyltransferase [Pseudomonadota bacterium]